MLYARTYYTEPEPAGLRAYALLRDALERSGKIAIARVALRQRETLAALRSRDGLLVLSTLLWPDEVRTPDFDFLDQDVDVRSQELKMASSLISSMTLDFDPSEYTDGYREALEELVAAKMQGHEVVRPQPRADDSGGGNLADALRASLAAAKADGESKTPASASAGTRKRPPRGKASA
jgi:DNA end-binding protein Ku